MGARHSSASKLKKSPSKSSFRRKLSCSVPKGNLQTKTLVVVFSQCSTDLALQCAVSLIELPGCVVRVHATTDDYDHAKRLGDKILLKHLNKNLFLHKVDLQSEKSTQETLLEICNMEGFIDVLVCHMDEISSSFIDDSSETCLPAAFDANFFPSLNLLKGIIPIFKKQKGGQVIYVNTIAGLIGLPMYSVYCSTKFAVEGLLESLASECIEHNIKFSIIETALKKHKNTTEVIHELPSDIPNSNHSERVRNMSNISSILQEQQIQKELKVSSIAGTIMEVIDTRVPYLRYTTNRQCANMIRDKLRDSRGLDSVKEVSTFFLNVDLDEAK